MFEIPETKREVLEKLTEKDWSPTDLAEEMGKSTQTLYNHLEDLRKDGILEKSSKKAKTRPKTVYSIDQGFAQFVAVLPGDLNIQTVKLTPNKEALLRIWSIKQPEFHPYLEEIWRKLKDERVEAIAVYGSVARGEASEESDIDLLIISNNEEIEEEYGAKTIEIDGETKMVMAQTYSREDYLDSKGKSSFLKRIEDELHLIYDPERILG